MTRGLVAVLLLLCVAAAAAYGAAGPGAAVGATRGVAGRGPARAQRYRGSARLRLLRPLRFSAVLSTPYIMKREPRMIEVNITGDNENETRTELVEEELRGNDRYEGFCIDLLEEITREIKMKYQIVLKEDGVYGAYDLHTDTWTGVIGDVVHQRTDAAIGDITITDSRDVVVDFTRPWLTSGIGLLTYRGNYEYGREFSLLLPFSVELWLAILATCVAVALLIFLLARLSPLERDPPAGATQDHCHHSWTPFTCCGSVWFAFATLFRQFTLLQPRAGSTRVLAAVWWLFVLLVVASYVATLSSILTLQGLASRNKIRSIYDLPTQDAIKYTSIYGGSTWEFLRNSQSDSLQRIFSNMRREAYNSPPIMSTAAGVEYVRDGEGKTSFFMEVPSIDYIIERQCDLQQLPGVIGENSYAIALQQDSLLLDVFNAALLRVREDGRLDKIRKRWWMDRRGGGRCMTEDWISDTPSARPMNTEDFCIMWLVLAVGAAVAVLLAVLECCWRASTESRRHDSGLCTEVGDQLRQAVVGPSSSTGFDVTTA